MARPAAMKGRVLAALAMVAAVADALAACGGGHTSGTEPASLTRAQVILESNGIAAGKEYRATRLVTYASGAGMIWVQRLYRGVPVFQDELAYHFDPQGRFKRDRSGKPFLGGEAEKLPQRDFDPTPQLAREAAKKVFAERAKVIDLTDPVGRPAGTRPGPDYSQRLDELESELGIYQGKLAWRICPRGSSHPYGFVSADTGSVLYFDSGIRS